MSMSWAKIVLICWIYFSVGQINPAMSAEKIFGILRVDSYAMRTILCVPWVAVGTTNTPIKVAEIIKTSNLTPASDDYDGDKLHYYSGSSFKSWRLVEGEGDSPPQWSEVPIVSASGKTDGTLADEQSLLRGDVLVLIRKNFSVPIYLQGSVGMAQLPSPTFSLGSKKTPSFNLVAPPSIPEGQSLLKLTTDIDWKNVGADDQILINHSSGQILSCQLRNGVWQYCTWSEPTGASPYMTRVWHDATIPVGTGFWYVSRSEVEPIVTWKAVPSL